MGASLLLYIKESVSQKENGKIQEEKRKESKHVRKYIWLFSLIKTRIYSSNDSHAKVLM